MKTITTYLSNGKIIGSFIIPDSDVELITAGNFYIEEYSNPQTQYVNNGHVVDLPSKPEDGYVFNYDEKTWVPDYNLLDIIAKNQRNQLLMNSDWTDTASAKARLGDQLYAEWQTYRQALRDITSQSGYPITINWPTPPQG